MIVSLVLALAVVASDAAGGARAEARATATIQRGVTVQNGTAATRNIDIAAVRRAPRRCAAPEQPATFCELIVYDLP